MSTPQKKLCILSSDVGKKLISELGLLLEMGFQKHLKITRGDLTAFQKTCESNVVEIQSIEQSLARSALMLRRPEGVSISITKIKRHITEMRKVRRQLYCRIAEIEHLTSFVIECAQKKEADQIQLLGCKFRKIRSTPILPTTLL